MSRARPAHRPFAVAAAVLLAALITNPAQAASPDPSTSTLRRGGPAWDRPTVDDPSRLIVTFRPGTTAAGRARTLQATGARETTKMPHTRAVALRAAPGRAKQLMASLRADPRVLHVSIDHHRYRDADPTGEPYWAELWGLENTGQKSGYPRNYGSPDADIDARQALDITTGDPTTVVAVIDDGVDFDHPDLASRAWTNPGESGGGRETNGIDDDRNGYVDDVHGWDFCHDDNSVHDADQDFHGTHVAGTIAASLNGVGVVGVAPNVSIMALKFISDDMPRDCGLDSQAIAAIAYAKSFGVHIVNASWGGRGDPAEARPLYDAIGASGALFVAAAGNEGGDIDKYPAALRELPAAFDLPNILSVAATDNSGGLAGFSNYGKTTVDIAAPGDGILSSLPPDTTHPDPGWGWGWLSGTSMAAPHVSGTAALIASAFPSLAADPNALKARLLGTGKPDPATAGQTVTGRVVDAFRALDAIGPLAKAPTTFGFVTGVTMGRASIATHVGWPGATDDQNGVASYGLQAQAGVGSWATVFGSSAARSTTRNLTFGTTYGFRDRARDRAGNWGAFVGGAVITPLRFQETSPLVSYTGSWRRYSTSSASGGLTRYASSRGASVTFRFDGRAFAVIAPKGPTRGRAKMYVDGAYVSTIDLHRSASVPRIVVAARSWSASGAHTVKLVVVGTSPQPRVDIDAFAILR